MRANHIQRIIPVSVLSTLLALVACSFLAFGSASAHAATQTGSSTIVRIVDNQQSGIVFSPKAITVTSGTPVRIVNRTPFTEFFHVTSNGRLFGLVSGASLTLTPTQSEKVILCSDGEALTITVI